MPESNKTITLTPSWKNYFWRYFFGVLLAPVLIGIVLIWHTNKTRKNIYFQISDNSITKFEEGSSTELKLINILETSLNQNGLQKIFSIGDIKLQANVTEIVLSGLEKPESLLENIDTAIAYQKEQLKVTEKFKPREASHKPGTLEKLDYLTGLWQQGLISDADYDEERKKFE